MNDDMLALAARVEALDGADREMDCLVGALLGLCAHRKTSFERCQGDSGYTCDDCGADSWGNKSKSGQRLDDKMPRFTASMDAVLSLVDKGDEWSISTLYCIARAEVGINRNQQTSWTGYGEHAGCNPVLAFLAASLRARASMGGE